MSFEDKYQTIKDTSEILKKQSNITRNVFKAFFISVILNIALVVALIILLPIKEKIPYILYYSNAEQNFVRVIPIGQDLRGEEALLKTLVASYVSKRETINRIDDTERYLTIRSQSNAIVYDNFLTLIKNESGIFNQNRYTRKIKIKNVSLISKQIAQVDFVAEVYQNQSIKEIKAYRATLQFQFSKQTLQIQNLEENPTGFIVTAYSISEINEDYVNNEKNVKRQ